MGFTNFATEAAWNHVVKKLGQFSRGQGVSVEWLEENGKISDGTMLEARLRTYFRRQGIVIVKRDRVYHLLTNAEQKEHAGNRRKHVKREEVRTLHEISAIDRDELDDVGKREVDHLQRHALARLEEHNTFERVQRALLGVPEPLPRLQAVKKP